MISSTRVTRAHASGDLRHSGAQAHAEHGDCCHAFGALRRHTRAAPAIHPNDQHCNAAEVRAFPERARILACMATRAEQFRAEQQISNKPPRPKKVRTRSVDRSVGAATAGVSGAGIAHQNLAKRSTNKGGPALEVSESAKPSRKSTRSSAGRVKSATELQRRQTRRINSPKARATKAAARS